MRHGYTKDSKRVLRRNSKDNQCNLQKENENKRQIMVNNSIPKIEQHQPH